MRAIYIDQHGGPEKLAFGERPDPEPGPEEVRVLVKACALNHLDIWVRSGLPGLSIPLPHIPGSDIAGVVEKTGKTVTGVKPGQRVLAAPGLSCGLCDMCRRGLDHLCPLYDILGQRHDGGYAEYVVLPVQNLIPFPDKFTFEEAASIPLTFLTAWHMLTSQARLQKGETILIQSGGSGLGVAAIQMAKLLGARVLTTVGSDEKAAKAGALGADEAINYTQKDFLDEAKALTKGRGVDVVFEHVGKATFEKSLLSLVPGGRMVICGATSGREAAFDLRTLFGRNITILGSRMGPRKSLLEAAEHWRMGRLKAVVDRVFPLPQAAEAHRYMEERKNFGKIVLTIP